MSDLLKNNPAALRHCLLYEFLRVKAVEDRTNEKSSIFAKYDNFCEVIGDDVMKYSEFEFWFCRFANGEFDLNYESDEEKKTYELMDMPIDVMKNVVEYLDIFDRVNLAKTSRFLRTFVKDQKLFHHTLKLEISHFEATVSLSNSVNIEYFQNSLGCKRIFKGPKRRVLNIEYAQHNTGYVKRINSRKTVVEGVTFWKQALLDFKSILKNPTLHLNTLEIRLYVNDEHVLNDLKDELKFTHYLNVKNVIIGEHSWELQASIVPMLKPGYLTSIDINSQRSNVDSMEKVFEMEQWKQAKYFTMNGFFIWPLHHLFHLKKFTVFLKQLSVEDIRQMKEISPNPCFRMSEFFKNNPTALRHCVRFEVLQGTPIDKAYSNICSVIGEEEEEKSIAEILRNDKYALRACILYESLKYKSGKLSIPVFDIFLNFCKVIGVEDVLKFQEFEFWFYRFLNGEHDLNYERDMDKKIYELMDMPIHVMEDIAEYLDIFDRANLIDTSRSLRTFFKDQKLSSHILKLDVSYSTATVSFGESIRIQYIKNIAACTKVCKNREIRIEGVAYWKKAIWDIRKILKNPKLHLDTLAIESNVNQKNLFNYLEDALKFTHLLKVESLILKEYSSSLLTRILPALKPGYLTSIDIDTCDPKLDSMNTVFEMEHWKQATCFTMKYICFVWPLHHLYHFKEFTVRLEELSLEHIREMKEVLFKSSEFERCVLRVPDYTYRPICEQEFGEALPEDPYIYHYPIPNSSEYFEIRVEGHRFKVARKKK